MTTHYIPIAGELKVAFEKAHPGETVDQAVKQWLEQQLPHAAAEPKVSLVEQARRIREDMKLSLTDDEFRALRHEGRP